MIPELKENQDEIDQILKLSKGWHEQHGRHAVLLSKSEGNIKCVPFPLSIVKQTPGYANSDFQRLLEEYDPVLQVVIYGNESNKYCPLTVLEGKNLDRAKGFVG